MPLNFEKFLESIATRLKCFCFIQCCNSLPEEQTKPVFPKLPTDTSRAGEKAEETWHEEIAQDIKNYHQALQRSLNAGELDRLLQPVHRPNSAPIQKDMNKDLLRYHEGPSRIERPNPFESAWS